MKTHIIFYIALIISFSGYAQQAISYKAIVKDDLGNVLNTQSVDVQFIIYEGAALNNNVYQENHTLMSDVNGIIVLNIGEGTTNDIFADVVWGKDEHWLNVQVDTGSGLVDMGTTQFMAVPYALNAANVSGLEEITQGNNKGWRLKDRDPNFYGAIGSNAVDLSISDISAVNGATGNGSFAANYKTNAQGASSSAFGWGTIAVGNNSLAIGQFNVADINGLFMIGNGTDDSNRKNALSLFQNGSFVVGSYLLNDDPAITTDNARLFFNKAKGAFRAGLVDDTYWDDSEVGSYSVAMGLNTKAMGQNSFAMGGNSSATGKDAVAMGGYANASGLNATAIGNQTWAEGQTSVALGGGTHTVGKWSTAMNINTTADALGSTVIGQFNVGGGTFDDWIWTDPLFEIGNSEDSNNKTNALTVLKNGTITAPSFDISEITDARALITKEYLEANGSGSTGLETVNEGNGFGWRLKGFEPDNYGPIGEYAVDLSYSSVPFSAGATGPKSIAMGYLTHASNSASTAMGNSTNASGISSTAMGSSTTASGEISISMGLSTHATGYNSTAMGYATTASGGRSTALGRSTMASGELTTAMGFNTKALSYIETVIGSFNTEYTLSNTNGPGETNWNPSDRLFVIGNGSSFNAKSNALTVLKNGTITAPSFDITEITDDKALVTKEYVDQKTPIAYGSVSSAGSILGGSGNFSVTYNPVDTTYTIFVDNEPVTANISAGIVTVNTSTFRTANTTYDGINMIVHIFLINGNKVQSPFQFVLYKE